LRRRDGWYEFENLKGILRAWQNKPWPIYELVQAVKTLFFKDADLLEGFEQYLMNTYPKGENVQFLSKVVFRRVPQSPNSCHSTE
jgi:histone deacetylase complex regulatory component SIN3